MSKEKYNQLLNEGFCIFENILSDALLDQLRSMTDQLCENMTEEHKSYFRSQGSAFRTYEDPVFAELISWQLSLDALQSMGFKNSTFTRMVRRLNPKYDGDAEPYGRVLYQRKSD